jgi:hypothetical protein
MRSALRASRPLRRSCDVAREAAARLATISGNDAETEIPSAATGVDAVSCDGLAKKCTSPLTSPWTRTSLALMSRRRTGRRTAEQFPSIALRRAATRVGEVANPDSFLAARRIQPPGRAGALSVREVAVNARNSSGTPGTRALRRDGLHDDVPRAHACLRRDDHGPGAREQATVVRGVALRPDGGVRHSVQLHGSGAAGSIPRNLRIAPRIGCRRFCAAFGRRDLTTARRHAADVMAEGNRRPFSADGRFATEEFPGRLASSIEVTGSSRAPDESPILSFSRIDRKPGRALTRCKHQRAWTLSRAAVGTAKARTSSHRGGFGSRVFLVKEAPRRPSATARATGGGVTVGCNSPCYTLRLHLLQPIG